MTMNTHKLDRLHNGYLLGGQPEQVGLAIKAMRLKMDPPRRKGRLERMRDRLVWLRVKSLGLRHRALVRLEAQYENLIIDTYIKRGGEVFYKTYRSPHGTPSPQKCKPYRRPTLSEVIGPALLSVLTPPKIQWTDLKGSEK